VVISTAYDAIRIVGFVRLRRWDLFKMLVKGYSVTLRNLYGLLERRRFVQGGRTVSDRQLARFFASLRSSAPGYKKEIGSQ
jgi:hypothetical protein